MNQHTNMHIHTVWQLSASHVYIKACYTDPLYVSFQVNTHTHTHREMGDGNRRIAIGFYEKASQNEKREASEFFDKLKSKRDGKIRVGEFKMGVESRLSKEKVFKELDLNGDGFLDFEDVLLLFYYNVKKAITILPCGRCSTPIFGPAYSCFECFFNYADRRFALCRDCYDKGNIQHRHPLTSPFSSSSSPDLLSDLPLLIKFSDLISTHPSSSPSKEELKKMWANAKSETGAASPAVEAMADNYFKSMRSNNSLDINKFSSILTKQQQEFLTPSPDSDPATNYMKNALADKFRQPGTGTATAYVAHHTASSSTPHTYYARQPSTYHPNPPTATPSNRITPLKAVSITFKIVDMALTIASLSSMCTIM